MSVKKEETVYFPVVGAQGVGAESAASYDARWRVLDAEGQALAAGDPGLAEVSVSLKFGYLVLRAPGMLRLDIPLDVVEDDPSVLETLVLDGEQVCVANEGVWAAAWFGQVLGHPARLVKVCTESELSHS